MNPLRSVLILTSLIILGIQAFGRSCPVESLEWLCDNSTGIGIYKLKSVTSGEKENHRILRLFREKTLSGIPPLLVKYDIFPHPSSPDILQLIDKSELFLVFFTDIYRDPSHLHLQQIINLNFPDTFPGTWKRSLAVDRYGNLLDDRNEILDLVKSRISNFERTPYLNPHSQRRIEKCRGFIRIELNHGELWDRLFTGRCIPYMVVPSDPEFLPNLIQAATEGPDRKRSAAVVFLRNYPTPEVKRLLKELLADSFNREMSDGRTCYPVRQAAYEVLGLLGENIEKPEGVIDDMPGGFLAYPYVKFSDAQMGKASLNSTQSE